MKLPVVFDANNSCIVTGSKLSNLGYCTNYLLMNDMRGTKTTVILTSIKPDKGEGLELVTISGSFPIHTDLHQVHVMFDDVWQPALSFTPRSITCTAPAARKQNSIVSVSVSLDGGSLFFGKDIYFEYIRTVIPLVTDSGSYIFQWTDPQVELKGFEPSLAQARTMYVDKYMSHLFTDTVALNKLVSMESLSNEEFIKQLSVITDHQNNALLYQLDMRLKHFETHGADIQDMAFAQNQTLVLLKDGSITINMDRYGGEYAELVPPTASETTHDIKQLLAKSAKDLSVSRASSFSMRLAIGPSRPSIDSALPTRSNRRWFFGSKIPSRPFLTRIQGFSPWQRIVKVSAGSNHFCAVTDRTSMSKLYSWGGNADGQLGFMTPLDFVSTPRQVPLSTRVTNVSCAQCFTICSTTGDYDFTTLFAWGNSKNMFPFVDGDPTPMGIMSLSPNTFWTQNLSSFIYSECISAATNMTESIGVQQRRNDVMIRIHSSVKLLTNLMLRYGAQLSWLPNKRTDVFLVELDIINKHFKNSFNDAEAAIVSVSSELRVLMLQRSRLVLLPRTKPLELVLEAIQREIDIKEARMEVLVRLRLKLDANILFFHSAADFQNSEKHSTSSLLEDMSICLELFRNVEKASFEEYAMQNTSGKTHGGSLFQEFSRDPRLVVASEVADTIEHQEGIFMGAKVLLEKTEKVQGGLASLRQVCDPRCTFLVEMVSHFAKLRSFNIRAAEYQVDGVIQNLNAVLEIKYKQGNPLPAGKIKVHRVKSCFEHQKQ